VILFTNNQDILAEEMKDSARFEFYNKRYGYDASVVTPSKRINKQFIKKNKFM
jgi:hypothetical protein